MTNMFSSSSNTIGLVRILSDFTVNGKSKMVSCNRKYLFPKFTRFLCRPIEIAPGLLKWHLTLTPDKSSDQSSRVAGSQNIGIAVEINLVPFTGRHLSFPIHLTSDSSHYSSCVARPRTCEDVAIRISCLSYKLKDKVFRMQFRFMAAILDFTPTMMSENIQIFKLVPMRFWTSKM